MKSHSERCYRWLTCGVGDEYKSVWDYQTMFMFSGTIKSGQHAEVWCSLIMSEVLKRELSHSMPGILCHA